MFLASHYAEGPRSRREGEEEKTKLQKILREGQKLFILAAKSFGALQ
jgi:hypothetical protein